ncbi:hypothetical protein [Nocardioides marmorisolisilvae]|uniref:Uncharacterized protein n=1 Tax=Nocardioides marmorisolisilvae TaxID=1542737 RepID=A0A3N0DIB9_9ACTN|nr:hypothetical protein [Nocardioides marmorisolisilvae]RNL75428.1 hypothetical protein EFL95_18635 [Nocardioides marmorisolisilvae]
MNYATRRAERRHAREPDREAALPDSLKAPDGAPIPIWDADASDPIDYLASVIDLLPGARPAGSLAGD